MDLILEMPELDGLNYVKGSNSVYPFEEEMALYKRVQAAGKIAVLSVARDRVDDCLAALDPQKLFLRTGAANAEEAEAILQRAARATLRHGK